MAFTIRSSIITGAFAILLSCNASKRAVKPVTADSGVWNFANVTDFEETLEKLRKKYHIPSLSVGIVNDKKLVWAKGFGYADIENKIVPDENTVYHLASITKTFGSIILMQLVEQGKLSLDDPISKYDIDLGARWSNDPRIKIKHLLTHTARGNNLNGFKPGYSFRYNGDWYSRLGKAIEKASGKSFGELLTSEIILPLGMKNTAPSLTDTINFNLTGYNMDEYRKKVAKPYNWQGHQLAPVKFRYGFGPAAGLMSSVSDLAKYSVAIDEQKFLQPETWEKMFTPFVSPKGKTFQYGLGWFVKYYQGIKMIWHTGWWFGYSTLFLKIPQKDLTFIILANSQDLSRPFYLTLYPIPMPHPLKQSLNKDLMISDFARTFVAHFVE